jgi:hypothetical protein
MWTLSRLDDLVHRCCPAARPFSYDQIVVLSKSAAEVDPVFLDTALSGGTEQGCPP